jgi:metalloendopeptidase OMA1, mitochondrial
MKYLKSIFPILLISFIFSGCTTVPYTDRNQLILVSQNSENRIGKNEYTQFLNRSEVSFNRQYVDEVNRVGKRIAIAADKKDYEWKFAVVDSNEVNAFCLPGGKIVVYTGLFKYIKSDSDIATVFGHEVGHAIARHTGEAISRAYIESSLSIGINITLAVLGLPGIFGAAYGAATQLGIELPYSRSQEYEADYIGLMLMAKAGYDPKKAIIFWEEFSKESQYGSVQEFFSTHPMGSKRVSDLKDALPAAEKLFIEYKKKGHYNPS